jgi:Rieske Fe-S protein
MKRRTFLDLAVWFAVGALGSLVAYPVLRFIIPPRIPEAPTRRVLASELDELAPSEFKIFPFGGEPGILVRTEDREYRSLSATCTHLACTVQYRAEENDIWCACHNGVYDLEGRNISGPPPRPLDRFAEHVTEEGVVVEQSKST